MPTFRPAPLFPKILAANSVDGVPSLTSGGAPVWVNFEDFGADAVTETWPWEGGATATLKLKCYWQDRYAVVQGLRGGVVAAGTSWRYYTMAPYPYSTNLYCTSIPSIRGLKPYIDTRGLCQYEFAIFDAFYSRPTYSPLGETVTDPSGIPMTTTKFKGSCNVFAPPTGSYFYTGGGHAGEPVPDTGVGIVQGRVAISLTRHMVPFPVLEGPTWLMGCVNNSPVTFGDKTFPEGCLLCATFDADPNPDPSTGNLAYDYQFELIGNYDLDWNEVLDPDGEYVLINTEAGGGGEFPFPYEDFSLLFSNNLMLQSGDNPDDH